MNIYKTTTNKTHNGLSINTNAHKHQACSTYMLDQLHHIFNHALCRHNKTFMIRFDLRFNDDRQYENDNRYISKFFNRFIKKLNRQQLDPVFMWTREKCKSINHHYHCVLLLDGSKTQNIYGHLSTAEHIWQNVLNTNKPGLINHCDRHTSGMMIHRDNKDSIDLAFEWASYLCKVNGKESLSSIRRMGSSTL